MDSVRIPLESVVVSKDIYPRLKVDDQAVQRYRDNLLPWEAVTPRKVIVWLNCIRDGLDYGQLVAYVSALKGA